MDLSRLHIVAWGYAPGQRIAFCVLPSGRTAFLVLDRDRALSGIAGAFAPWQSTDEIRRRVLFHRYLHRHYEPWDRLGELQAVLPALRDACDSLAALARPDGGQQGGLVT